nr:MAG TPA: hypothetical protein [Caudoviricetes sp.]
MSFLRFLYIYSDEKRHKTAGQSTFLKTLDIHT